MMRWFLYGMVLWSCSHSLAYAGINHAVNLDWKTQESAHFRIHFYAGEQVLANRSLHIAESVYTRLTPIFDWYPQEKTEIVLSDEMDASNGFAMPIPSNRITLFVSRLNSVNSLEDHAGWLETLILHEFVHTLHLDKARGDPKNIRNVFGRILLAFPNVFMPAWLHEGLATYYETDKKLGIGRGQSSYFRMMMRLEVDSGFKPLRQVNQPMVSWPLLTSRYLYGVYFYQFIADTYGEDKLQALVHSYSNHMMPFRINGLYEDVLGKDLSVLWDEYQTYVEAKFQPQISAIQSQGLIEGKALTQSGDFKSSVLQADDGRIFYVSDNLESGSWLQVIEQGNTSTLLRVNAGARLDWHEQAGLLLTQPDICNNANTFYDIYKVDSVTGEQTQLTSCQRYIFAVWSPDGKQIAAVKNERGQHALHLLNDQGTLQEVLWQGKDDETLSGLDSSADGQLLLSSVWRKGTAWDVETFDMQTKAWSKITDDMLVQTDAKFVLAGHDIVFSADYDGVYNIYKLSESSQLTQLTHVVGGAFSPWVSTRGELLSIDYTAQGFDVYQLEKPLQQAAHIQPAAKTFAHVQFVDAQFPNMPVDITAPVDYSAWDSVLPTSWLPSLVISNQGIELGVFTFGTDVLKLHNYSLFAGYNATTSSPVFALDYIYDGWFPLLKTHVEKSQIPTTNASGDVVALFENQRLDTELIFPWLNMQERWSAHLAFSHQRNALAWLHPAYTYSGSAYTDTLAGTALVYDARYFYGRSISNGSAGRLWHVRVESGAGFDGDYQGSVWGVSGREYVDLGNAQVLAFRLDMGLGDHTSRPFRLGGVYGGNILPNLLDPLPASVSFNQRAYALRGYGENEPVLTGQSMGLVSAEYRFPISRIERGWMAPPLGIHQIFGQVFVDVGRVDSDLGSAQTYVGTGLELGADLILFYNLPARLQLGYAEGLDDTIGGKQVYFRLGSSF